LGGSIPPAEQCLTIKNYKIMEKIDKIHFEIMLLANREDDKFKNELYKLLENFQRTLLGIVNKEA